MTVDGDGRGDADVTITGGADAIYLALWNRGDEIEVAGDDDAARAMARSPARALELSASDRGADCRRRVRGSAQPASTPFGSTTIAWACPKALS